MKKVRDYSSLAGIAIVTCFTIGLVTAVPRADGDGNQGEQHDCNPIFKIDCCSEDWKVLRKRLNFYLNISDNYCSVVKRQEQAADVPAELAQAQPRTKTLGATSGAPAAAATQPAASEATAAKAASVVGSDPTGVIN